MEETQAEEFKPGLRIWFGAVDKFKGGGQFNFETDAYMVEHSISMEDGPVSVLLWYIFLCEVGVVHLNKSAPGAFEKTFGALSLGGSCNYLGLVVVDPSKAL